MSCLFRELILFDPSRETINLENQILLGIVVMIVSNLISISIMKMYNNKLDKIILKESTETYKSYVKKDVTPGVLFCSDLVNSVIYAPISEELFFRYFFLKIVLTRKFKLNFHLANVIQAVLFGSFHLTNQVYTDQKSTFTLVQMFSSSISGLLNGYIYYYSNSIIPCLVSHMVNNLIATSHNYSKYSDHFDKS